MTTENLQFSHSGTFGDMIYSLSLVKHLGGGDYFLRLHNIDHMARETFGPNANAGDHAGEMSQEQFDSMVSFMAEQPYIKSFKVYNGEPLTHELEYLGQECARQRGNYTWSYARSVGINPLDHYNEFMLEPWLTVPDPIKIPGKPIVVNWMDRHRYGCQPKPPAMVEMMRRGLCDVGVYVGLPHQHKQFEDYFGVKIDYYPTSSVLECSQVIAGAEQFVGTQSMCLSIAIGLGKTYICESRKDIRPEQNECYFVRPNAHYI
jgi:hypothetical protein